MNKLIIIFGIVLGLLTLTACGQQGAQGIQGPPGNSNGCSAQTISISSVAPNGGSMIECSDGTSSLILNGSNGVPGSLGIPVKFCTGITTYPSTFIEVGFIIQGAIYAVYSANGGFLTQIPPGYYTSNAIGSSCNFTVNADNTISH